MKWLLWGVGGLVVLGLAVWSSLSDGVRLNAHPGTMPDEFKTLYLAAAKTCPGLPPEVLMAIGEIESGHGANDGPSYAGAIGPMQFMISTWVAYGVDANHDGIADPFDPADAIQSAANLLCADGAGNPNTLMTAVALYNPGDPTYALNVLQVAQGYVNVVTATTATVTAPPTSTATPHH